MSLPTFADVSVFIAALDQRVDVAYAWACVARDLAGEVMAAGDVAGMRAYGAMHFAAEALVVLGADPARTPGPIAVGDRVAGAQRAVAGVAAQLPALEASCSTTAQWGAYLDLAAHVHQATVALAGAPRR